MEYPLPDQPKIPLDPLRICCIPEHKFPVELSGAMVTPVLLQPAVSLRVI